MEYLLTLRISDAAVDTEYRYDVLRDYVSQYGDAIRLNSYMSIDEARMRTDYEYKDRTNGFLSIVRSYGFKIITKAIRWFEDEDGQRIGKANADLDMAVDMLLQSQHLDIDISADR